VIVSTVLASPRLNRGQSPQDGVCPSPVSHSASRGSEASPWPSYAVALRALFLGADSGAALPADRLDAARRLLRRRRFDHPIHEDAIVTIRLSRG
jgi:hypothetical protein